MASNQKVNIVKLLLDRNITQTQIAIKAGVSPQAVNIIIAGRGRSKKVEDIITQLTGFKFPPNSRVPRGLLELSKIE